jgi:VIT1/CCC1 family predicted Fe2+/Mn2+ transporter
LSDSDFHAEVQRRIDAQARERAIAAEVKLQGGHYRRVASNWLAGFIASAFASICILAVGYASTSAHWAEPVAILLAVIACACLTASIIARLTERSRR